MIINYTDEFICSIQITIQCTVHFGERIHDGQYSLVRFLYAVLLLTVHPVPSQCKSGGTSPPHLDMESALLALTVIALKS